MRFFSHFAHISLLTSQMVGLERLELSTSRLSGVRSNLLSYRPIRGLKPALVALGQTTPEILLLKSFLPTGAKPFGKVAVRTRFALPRHRFRSAG